MQNILPGLNYDAELQSEDYTTYRNLVETAILSRFLLSTGSPPFTTPQTGIVDILDPSQISSSEITRPFLITVSNLNALNLNINPGLAVTPSGALVSSQGNFSFPLARTQANDINIVFIENILIPGGATELNDYMEPLASQDVQNPTNLGVALIQDWNNVSLFPPNRKLNIVVLAAVTVVPTANAGLELQVDMTQNTYPYVRPWFSIKDIQHRSMLGSGTVTTQNPHATSINDLTPAGTVGLFQGLFDTGLVVSRDSVVNKMVGARFCQEIIPLTRVKYDTTGDITAKSPYGKVNAQYVELLSYPTRLGSVYEQGKQANSISAEVMEGTNILVFGSNESLQNTLIVEYNDTAALLPPVAAPTPLLTFGLPVTNEVIVAGGLTYATIPNPTVDLSGAGPFPRRISIYQLGNGSLVSYPQVLIPATTLDAIGTSMYAPLAQPAQIARIRLGITKATVVPTMDIQVTLFGKDVNGNNITEVLEISTANGYVDEAVPSTNYDSPNQSVVSTNIYATLTNIQITSRTDDGPQSTLQLWSEIEPANSPAINDAVLISRVNWNGQGVANIEDVRLISKGYFRPNQQYIRPVGETLLDSGRVTSNLQVSPLLTENSIRLFTEDFEDLRFFDSSKGFAAALGASAIITLQNNGFLANGDTVKLTPTKTITFVTGSPDLTSGQVQIGGTIAATQSNIIATINSSLFNSNVVASLGSGNNVNLLLSSPLGSIGNTYALVPTLANALALSVSGFSAGYDAYGECYLNRTVVGLKSLVIPPDSNSNPAGYYFRERYRSRAASLPPLQSVQPTFGVEIHGEDKFYPTSVRIRGADLSAPNVWGSWQIMIPIAAGNRGFYEFTFPAGQHKIQIEYYGRARGLTVYNLKPNP